ncbi:hypothetical protein TSPI_01997 [Trichinella spiralis]|uniref:Uncharacterized protein n=1 Tax=Trichinella spiralis TaxID=6334 RepID=A0ABR3KAD1_TRISP
MWQILPGTSLLQDCPVGHCSPTHYVADAKLFRTLIIVFNIFPLAGEQNDSPKRPPEAFCYRAKRSVHIFTAILLHSIHNLSGISTRRRTWSSAAFVGSAVLELKCDVHER